MVSIQKFLGGTGNQSANELAQALLGMAHLLLQAIRLHAVEGNREDFENFQAEIQSLDSSLSTNLVASKIPVIAGSATQSLQSYNRRTSAFVKAQGSELQMMISKLTDTVTAIAGGSERSISQLEQIQNKIQRVSVIEDIRVLNSHLSECLQDLKQETLRQREEVAKTITFLKSGLDKRGDPGAQASSPSIETSLDLTSGLPSRAMAEAAIQQAFDEGSRTFVVVFAIQRLDAINIRFGRVAGDHALKQFGRNLAKRITANHRLFRWSGPSFVALMERSESTETIQEENTRLASRSFDLIVDVQGRSILLPLSAKATVFPPFQIRSTEILIQQIDCAVSSENQSAIKA